MHPKSSEELVTIVLENQREADIAYLAQRKKMEDESAENARNFNSKEMAAFIGSQFTPDEQKAIVAIVERWWMRRLEGIEIDRVEELHARVDMLAAQVRFSR